MIAAQKHNSKSILLIALVSVLVLLILLGLVTASALTPNPEEVVVPSEYSMEDTLAYLCPTAVQLFCQVDEYTQISGSGFIMEITDDFVYICTNRHVIKDQPDWEVYFYDGTKLKGTQVGCSELYDVGVVKVALTEIPQTLLPELMPVYIDMEYWQQLADQNVEIGLVKIDKEGGIEYTIQGTLLKLKEDFTWGNQMPHTEMKLDQSSGDSGSAIFDRHGYLVAMVYGTSHEIDRDRNWGIPLDALTACYQEIME